MLQFLKCLSNAIYKDCLRHIITVNDTCLQGMVDGSASKPALRQDTRYMVEKTYYDLAPYLGAFWAYLMPQ